MNEVHEITADKFRGEVIDVTKPVIVYFYTPYCGICRAVTPMVERLAEWAGDRAKVVKLNAEESGMLVKGLRIPGTPTIIVLHEKKEARRYVGEMDEEKLRAEIEPLL